MSTYRLCAAFTIFILLAAVTGAKTVGYLPAQGEFFTRALSQVGLTPDDVRFNSADMGLWGGDKYRLNVHRFLFDNPWKTSEYTRALGNGLLKNGANLGALVTSSHGKLDNGIRLGLTGDPLEAERKRIEELGDKALAVALSELGGLPPEAYTAQDKRQGNYDDVPPQVRQAAALVLFTLPRALRYRELGLMKPMRELGLDPAQVYKRVLNFSVTTFAEEDGTSGNEVLDDLDDCLMIESLLDHVDWNLIHTGTTLLAIATQEAQKIAGEAAPGYGWRYSAATPFGTVRLAASATSDVPLDDYLLVISGAGHDMYRCGAGTRGIEHPASIVIDLGGDDSYVNSDDNLPAFGSGIFGTGILIDCAGNDRYETTYAGEGAGIFGTGVLYDMAGDDRYESFGNSQASGTFGTGLLVDLAGNDYYGTYKYGKGYGFTRGCGMLIDAAGDDSYYANMVDHFNGGLYGANHHVHFVQGSAFGRRSDFTDGHSWAGGFGLVLDGAGNDKYEADCYGQGNAYWYSVGMVIDKAGNDVYRAGQYSQASAPHFACGVLQDEGGDDSYTITIRQSMGHGRDWSLAWFEDAGGNDFYQGARTTLGTSHVNAISVFWDRAGDDTYLAKGPSFGASEPEISGSPRDWLLTLGIFVDGGGKDHYLLLPGEESYEASNTYVGDMAQLDQLPVLDFCGDGKMWVRTPPAPESPGYCGVGLDSE